MRSFRSTVLIGMMCVGVALSLSSPSTPGQAAMKISKATLRKTSEARLTLRGGGPPIVPLAVVAVGAGILLKTNEGVREKVMGVLSHIKIGGDGRRPRKKMPSPSQKLVQEEKVERAPLKDGYDLHNGTWAYEVDQVEPGCLLVASPDTFRFAGQRQVLDQTVVLVVRHGKQGSSGFIINRPTVFTVGDVTQKLNNFETNPLFLGGDLGEGVYMIHGFSDVGNSTEVSEGIYYGGSDEAMEMVAAGKATPQDFRFFFKYTAWVPGQLEAEIAGGCWCPIRTSLDLVLKPRVYQGLHIAKHHKVYWHQVLKTLGGRFDNISSDTIQKEENERMKMEEWTLILKDGVDDNKTVDMHEGVELGVLAMAAIGTDLDKESVEAVGLEIDALTKKVKDTVTQTDGPKEILAKLNAVFFLEYTLTNSEADKVNEAKEPTLVLINEVITKKQGTALALSPLYMAIARQAGVTLRAANCTAQMRAPHDFYLVAGKGDDALIVDLAMGGKIMTVKEAMGTLTRGTSADLNGVPHVQLYSCFMHRLADSYSRIGNEAMVLTWLAQLRVLQGAINSRILTLQDTAEKEVQEGSVLDLLGDAVMGPDGASVSTKTLEGKYVALYFSAQWCAPCKAFTPKLIETYKHVKEEMGKNFEIIFISSDRSNEAFQDYYATMPWLALPFGAEERRIQLGNRCKVEGIPKLVLLNPDGSVLSMDGRGLISADPEGKTFPWA